jgi:hypothetical protein
VIPKPGADAAMEWERMLRFIGEHGVSVEASAMVEDFIDRRADDFIEQIEAETGRNRAFAELVAMAHLGDMSAPGVERIARLQDQLNEDGDFSISRWRGWAPLEPTEES